ncbi:MAG: histidine kinase dimerization/phospho-acceptor domain-containing protein, partial [Promethearchaeota archaeon]
DTFQDILEVKGFSVHSCNTGREGLNYAKSNFVNVAIVDIRLPDMSGESLLYELKEISSSTETIVLTGFGSLDTAVEAITQQAFAYLLKPIDPEILIRTIKNCIEKQELLLLLKESENRFRMQFKHFPIPAYIWQKKEEEFVLIDYNLHAEKITAGKISKFQHVKAQDLYHDRPEILNDMKLCFENKTDIQQEMLYEYKTTGGKKFLSVSYSFVPPDLIVVYTEDITEKKRMEQARIELENKRTRFISMTSHELRTPLTAIQGFLEILEDRLDELDQERRDQCLKIIKRNLFRIERLVDGVSDLVKIEQGFFDLELKEIDFIDFLEQAMQTYKPFLGDQLEVIHRQGNISALIESDVDRLNQVIDNIINNAIKHTSKES